ncbi:hypothetical protein FRB95_001577 [Tulasnella sp. JGI-2019a]|nr:hypothetical protein FRB95_001577 [Tulasnella sp. JGI-2019a]
MSTSTTNSSLFRNAHNVPLKCFIQPDTTADRAQPRLRDVLQAHGAVVSDHISEALVVLVDPPTPGGQKIIRELGGNSNRAVLDFSWVKRCVENERWLGPKENWGGHRPPITNVNEFFSIGPADRQSSPPRQPTWNPVPPRMLPYPFQHDRDIERYHQNQAPSSIPAKSVTQSGHFPSHSVHVESARVGQDGCPMPLRGSAPNTRFTVDDGRYLIAFFNWYLLKNPEATSAQVLGELASRATYRSLRSWTYFFHQNEEKWRHLIKGLRDTLDSDWVGIETSSKLYTPEMEHNGLAGCDLDDVDGRAIEDAGEGRSGPERPRSAPAESSICIPRIKNRQHSQDEKQNALVMSQISVLAPYKPSPQYEQPRHLRASTYATLTPPSRSRPPPREVTVSSSRFFRSRVPGQPRQTEFGMRGTWKPFTSQEKFTLVEFLADNPWVWVQEIAKVEWLRGARTNALATWQKFENAQPHRSYVCWREYHKQNAEVLEAAAKRIRMARDTGDLSVSAQSALTRVSKHSISRATNTLQAKFITNDEEDAREEIVISDDEENVAMAISDLSEQ